MRSFSALSTIGVSLLLGTTTSLAMAVSRDLALEARNDVGSCTYTKHVLFWKYYSVDISDCAALWKKFPDLGIAPPDKEPTCPDGKVTFTALPHLETEIEHVLDEINGVTGTQCTDPDSDSGQ